jgi:hypothetical protein
MELLYAHQDRLLALVAEAEALVEAEPDRSAHRLATIRWEMVRLMREYQLFKHGEIFDPMIASGSATQAALARDLKARCHAASDRYVEHTRRWSTGGIMVEWADYRLAVLAMADAVRDHMQQEREAVTMLLVGRERTRSGAPAAE